MNMVKNVGSKLDEKIKSGDIKESELLQEASEMMKNMKDMPGFGNIQEMLGKMGGAKGGKVNTSAMHAHMQRNIRLAQQKERLRAKANKNVIVKKEMSCEELKSAEEAAKKAQAELLQMIDNDKNNLVFRAGEGAVRSSKRKKGKRKKKKKKNKEKSDK